jgi:DNA-binding Lrp family transcriptional regulator
MGVTNQTVITAADLNATDEALLDQLQEGRVTPIYAAEEIGRSREYTSDRIKRLHEHGHVRKLSKGLYELVDDPRES